MRIKSAGLQAKLAGAFLLVSVCIAAFVALTVWMEIDTIKRAARLEAEHVALTLASPDVKDAIHKADFLQARLDRSHSLSKRDAVIVDARKIGLADVDRDEVGQTYAADSGNEVGQTITDGIPRTFVEKNEKHPEGAMQVVVPFRAVTGDAQSPIVGAVILEYTPIYQELFAAARANLYTMAAAGIASIFFATIFGWRVARGLSVRIEVLQGGVSAIAAGDYDMRVVDSGKDEIGVLGAAFNRMATDLNASRAALREHALDLERRVEQRTLELSPANTRLAREVREGEIAAERIEFLAYYDSLTGLPNRGMFARLLEQGIAHAQRYKKQLAVFFIDLDRFKQINDTLGHEAGDLLLKVIAQRLKSCLRKSDAVARLGGDEFVVMLTELGQETLAGAVAEKILTAISRPVTLHGQEFHVTGSIGISTYPDNGSDERALMKNADIAMYHAKEEGKNAFRFYTDQQNVNSLERLTLESSLRHALEHNEFQLHYQPKIDLQHGQVTGVEALLRWQHPDLGIVSPVQFIPIAEETGLIVPIGKWVLKTACKQHALWHQQGLPELSIAVNLSPRQFTDEFLMEDIKAILQETAMDPTLLELEITESMLMQNPKKAIETLTALKELGIHLAIDDFGTGYSSLSNLKLFPIDTIKVDRSFIRNLPEDANDKGITDAIITMGRTLGLKVVAEGVETREQAEFLSAHHCDEFQGFLFSKAVPADELAAVLLKAPPAPTTSISALR